MVACQIGRSVFLDKRTENRIPFERGERFVHAVTVSRGDRACNDVGMTERTRTPDTPTKLEDKGILTVADQTFQMEAALETGRGWMSSIFRGANITALALAAGLYAAPVEAQEKQLQRPEDLSPQVARVLEKSFNAPIDEVLAKWHVSSSVDPREGWGLILHYKQHHVSSYGAIWTMAGGSLIDKSIAAISWSIRRQTEAM